MALQAPQSLAATGGKAAQGDTLVDLHKVSDGGSLTDDNAGTMVDEKMMADGSAGMDVNAGGAVGILRHDSGQHRHTHAAEYIGQPVDDDGIQAGITEDDLIRSGGSRVAVQSRLHIRLHQGSDLGDLPQEIQGHFLGAFLGTTADQGDLPAQVEHHILHEHGKIVPGVVDPVAAIPGVAGHHQADELAQNVDHQIFVQLIINIQLVDGAILAVVLQDTVHHGFNLLFDGVHILHLSGRFFDSTIKGHPKSITLTPNPQTVIIDLF